MSATRRSQAERPASAGRSSRRAVHRRCYNSYFRPSTKRRPSTSNSARLVSFVPPKIQTYDPDYDKIREMVDDAFAKAEDGQSGGKRHHRHGEEAANHTGDLAASC